MPHTPDLPAVTEDEFDTSVLEASRTVPVVVDVWATWCRPCLMMTPVFEELAAWYGDRLRIVAVNLDAEPELGARCGITGLPTVLVYSGGEEVERLHGARSKADLREAFDRVV